MAVTDFTGSDVLVVIAALGAAIATIVGARGARKQPEPDGSEDLADLRAYIERTFVPREEFDEKVQHLHDARHALRNEMQANLNNHEGRIRIEIRDLGLRVDQVVAGPRRRT